MKTINFAEQFVPLIESGRKTQTRRLMKVQPSYAGGGWKFGGGDTFQRNRFQNILKKQSFKIGEIFSVNGTDLHCEITAIRVERVRDISQEDSISEGAPKSHSSIDFVSRQFGFKDFSRSWFGQKWESIYPGSWKRNDWVWVYEFRRVL